MTYSELIEAQEAHYATLQDQSRANLQLMGAADGDIESVLAQMRTDHAADLARFRLEARALFDRGGRTDEALH